MEKLILLVEISGTYASFEKHLYYQDIIYHLDILTLDYFFMVYKVETKGSRMASTYFHRFLKQCYRLQIFVPIVYPGLFKIRIKS